MATIIGTSGTDVLVGGTGDILVGGLGNDTYVVSAGNIIVVEAENEGTDLVQSSVSWTLGANLEHLTLSGTAAINGTGNGLNNILIGNSGANVLTGGAGSDIYYAGVGDTMVENANEGMDLVYSDISWTLDANIEKLTLTGSAAIDGTGNSLNNILIGNSAANVLIGGAGNDQLDGGAGADVLVGGAGDDTYNLFLGAGDTIVENANEGIDLVLSATTYTLGANLENLTLLGGAFDGTGNELDNTLVGSSGANVLTGGAGNDTYVVNRGDTVVENANEGTDLVVSDVTWALGANLEHLTLSGSGAITGVGNSLNNILTGNIAANVLIGGAGNDTYVVSANDLILESEAEGTDLVVSNVSWTLGANLEHLTLSGTAAINGTGNSLNNTLTGNSAANVLAGGAGNDTLAGGLGNDTYLLDNENDVVTEQVNEGTDTVQSSVTYTLTENVENLTLTETGAINGTGNSLNNTLTGNSASNVFTGGLGNDTYYVSVGDAVVENANEGTDLVVSDVSWALGVNLEYLTLSGTGAIDGTGNSLNNTLRGNSAANVLAGGAGSDTYYVGVGDVVAENANEGTDLVVSDVSWALGANLEYLTLSGTGAITGVGNSLNNTLRGNSAANVLIGGAGNDTYAVSMGDTILENTNEGTDTVLSDVTWALGANFEHLTLSGTEALTGIGNSLNNILTGNIAANVLIGGAGNDTYVVSANDLVVESEAEGTDLVVSDVSWVLGANFENLTLSGTAAINGTGNSLNNTLTGNSAANVLTGGAGNDTLAGGLGHDTYLLDNENDVVTEQVNEGTDTVQSSVTYTLTANVENLTLTGTGAINGTGNSLNNTLTGNSASNVLAGGAGSDTLAGGLSNDTYYVSVDDAVVENANEGTDLVVSDATWVLGANLEYLTLSGTGVIDGTGNSLNNTLRGNSAANVLTGGAGNDTYYVGVGDAVAENANEGTDLVVSDVSWALAANLERLTLTGTGGIDGTGNSLSNVLTGNSAANVLTGGAGNDTLAGGLGNDTYRIDRGQGQDTIAENDGTGGNSDGLLYGATINPLDLVLSRQVDHLRIAIHGSTDAVTIQNWFSAPTTAQVETIQAGNGQTLLSTHVDQLIQAMASFSQQTGLTWDQAIDQQPQNVQTVLAASWQ